LNLSRPTLLQCNWVLGSVASLLLLSAFLSRLQDKRICTWIAVLSSAVAVYLILRGFGSRLSALLRVGFVYLGASWCAYGLWRYHTIPHNHLNTAIDPFARSLSIMVIFNFAFGLTTWVSALWVNRKGPYLERFIKQRVYWFLGSAMIFTSSYFSKFIAGI